METPRLIFFATIGFEVLAVVAMAILTFVLELIDVITMTYVVVAVGILSAFPLVYAIKEMNGDVAEVA